MSILYPYACPNIKHIYFTINIYRRLLRTAAVISDTHCFVDIFGLGVAGRVLAPGGPTNRLLLVEAYSVWDSVTYTITIHIPHLKVCFLYCWDGMWVGTWV